MRLRRSSTVSMPTVYGDFTAVAFRELLTGKHHVALVKGDVDGADDVLVRVHSECLTGDVFDDSWLDGALLIDIGVDQRMLAKQIDHARDAH
jgi:3,4-dihydroxy 2-butanone 4-phosphate synthase/GTP cyclohydrolase II